MNVITLEDFQYIMESIKSDRFPTYDSQTKIYTVNDVVFYNHYLYKCITAVTVPEEFDSNKWTKISLAEATTPIVVNKTLII